MAYDDAVADRVRKVLKRRKGISERKMFGGIAFMLNGNMVCGVNKKDLVLRLGKERAANALSEPHIREMDFTGRPMKGMVFVGARGFQSDAALEKWMQYGLQFALSLPPKKK